MTQAPSSPLPPATSTPDAPATASGLWRVHRARVLGHDGERAFSWAQGNVIEETSLRTGEVVRRSSLIGAPYVGEPRAWWPFRGSAVGHFDGLVGMKPTARGHEPTWRSASSWSSSVRVRDGLLAASTQAVTCFDQDGKVRWTAPLPRGAQVPDMHASATRMIGVWQHYDPDAPTPKLDIPHRVGAFDLETGRLLWMRDFREHLGAVAAWEDLLVIARGADLVLLDGATGAVRREHPRLGHPNIYPAVALDATRVVVALQGRVLAFSHQGDALWQTQVEGIHGGTRLALAPDAIYASVEDGSVVRLTPEGQRSWRIGLGVSPIRLLATSQAIVADAHGLLAGIPLPARVATERASFAGTISLGTCAAPEISLRIAGQPVAIHPDGSFQTTVEAAGFVTATARQERSEAEFRPCPQQHQVLPLDGRGSYRVQLRLCGCGASD